MDPRKSTTSHGQEMSAWKYDQLKPKTMPAAHLDHRAVNIARLVGGEEYRVYIHAALVVHERENHRQHPGTETDTRDYVRTLVPVEGRIDHLQHDRTRIRAPVPNRGGDPLGSPLRVAPEIAPRRSEGEVFQHAADHGG